MNVAMTMINIIWFKFNLVVVISQPKAQNNFRNFSKLSNDQSLITDMTEITDRAGGLKNIQ